MKERIQKILSEQGYCSRRAAEELLKQGRIKVNGHRAVVGDKIDILKDVLAVDDVRVVMQKRVNTVYYILHKPRGFVTTLGDRHAAKSIADLTGGIDERVYPVGRLDKDSEGLLLLTNDGNLTNILTHPSAKVAKLYRATVRPAPKEEQLIALSSGVVLDDGYKTQQTTVRVLVSEPNRGVLEIVLFEGKNRQIRRMCDAVGLEVVRLKRTAIGPVRLGMLKPGEYRELRKEEVMALRNAYSKNK